MRRYYGWKKGKALMLGGALGALKMAFLSSPNAGVPYQAIVLVERINLLAVACLGFQILAPASILFRKAWQAKRRLGLLKKVVLSCLALACVPPATQLKGGAGMDYVLWSVATLGTMWAPLAVLEMKEWLLGQNWFCRMFTAGEGAAAGMAPIGEMRRRRFETDGRSGYFSFNDGLLLGRSHAEATYKSFFLRLRDELGTLLLGAARSGKSVRFLWLWMATNDQIKVVVDPKAHGLRLLAGRLSDPDSVTAHDAAALDPTGHTRAIERLKDGKVLPWDPFGLGAPYQTAAINVVLLVDPDSDYCRIILSAISQAVVIPSGSDAHWVVELSRLVIEGLVLHVRTQRPIGQQNLGHIAELFAGLDEAEDNFRDTVEYEQLQNLLREMSRNLLCGGISVTASQAFANLDSREAGIIISEVARSLKSFTDPVIRRATSGRGIDCRAVVESESPVTLFLSLPFGALAEHQRVLRVIVSCLLRLTEHRRDKSRAVHFFLDEFAAYAKNLTAVRDATVTLGGAGARLHIALQYIHQLRQCLGVEAADAFEASSNIVAAGIGDHNTAEFISKRFGNHTVEKHQGWWPFRRKVNESESPVLDPRTVARLLDRKSRTAACIPGVGAPFLFETLAYRPLRLHGTRMGVWPLPADAFDDHLLAEERGQMTRPADDTANLVATPQLRVIPAPPQPTLRIADHAIQPGEAPVLRIAHRT